MAVPGAVANPESLHTEDVSYQSGDDTIQAYLARPRAAGTYPGIIVIHEAFGLVEHINDLARRFANTGFIALAPNLYSREGPPDPTSIPSIHAKVFGISDERAVRDLEGAAAYLRGQEGANGKVGVIGFCSGGRQTLLFASSSGAPDAAVDCWGGYITRATPDAVITPARPTPVMDLVQDLRCPLFAVFGAEDENPSPAEAEELRRRAEAAGKTVTVKVFENAGHGFLADYRPSYHEGAAFALWPLIVSFFETHLRT